MYKLSNFFQSPTVVSSSVTSLKTPSLRDNKIILWAFSSSSFLSFVDDVDGTSPSKIFTKPCCRNKACILMRQRLKLFWPSNFSTSNFPVVAISQNKDLGSNTNCCNKCKFQDHQKNRKVQNKKITQPHKTPRFKWFGPTSLHPLAKMIQKKFTNRRVEYKE
jgi:hypothetical protein